MECLNLCSRWFFPEKTLMDILRHNLSALVASSNYKLELKV